ncbi:MAG: glycosyltransferase family 39 protein [Planctomycetota bacterium]|nr:glycosyltransferase family 39 protein [Planctomycetota bacterium]
MKQKLFWVLLLALGLRIGAALSVHTYLESAGREFLIAGDAAGYWELGQKLAAGEEYSIYAPPRRAMRMPGYPVFIAASIKLGGNRLLPVRLLQACAGTAACWFVHLLGTLLIDQQTGLLAALLAAVSPTFVGFTPLVLSETLFAATLLISLILMAKLADGWGLIGQGSSNETMQAVPSVRRIWLAVGTGVAVGVACYVRPSWLLTAPLFCAIHLLMTSIGRRHNPTGHTSAMLTAKALECVFVVVGLALTLAPWTIRNSQVIGHAIPTTLWVGPSLYDGLNPEATGDSNMDFFERDNLLARMSEYDMDHEYRRRSWQFVRENPGRAVELGFVKVARFWKPWPNAAQFRQWWLCLIVAAFFVPTILLALLEAVRRRFNLRCLLLTAGPVIYFTVIHSVFVGSLRYRLPAEYPLLILSAAGLIAVRDWFSQRLAASPVSCP